MKNVFHGRHRRMAALALVFCLIITVPFWSRAAEKLDMGSPCSLTVKAVSAEKLPEDLANADIVVDLYQVAAAVPTEDMEGYTFQLCPSFEQLKLKNNMSASQWREQSQKAAEIALKNGAEGGAAPLRANVAVGVRIENLEAGLYLMAARGREIENYVDTNADGDIVTKALSGAYTYTFLPELVALPGKTPETEDAQNPDQWIYDMEIVLKMQWEENRQYGSLKIVKLLEGYDGSHGPAVFVFDVEAWLDGKNVYSDVVTIVFDRPGEKKLLVEGIPVGARVTVTEVYSGSCYSLVTEQNKTVTIGAMEDIPEVSFTNRRDDRPNGGHGITNHFKYGTDGWKLDQIYDKTQG